MTRSPTSPPTSLTRRRTLGLLAMAAVSCPGLSLAQAWPTKAVRIVVPFPSGGAADGSARVLGEVMAKSLGQTVVVENRPGAGGILGTQSVAQASDGHTLLMGSTSMTILPALRKDLPYDVQRDLRPIGMVSAQPLVLVVSEKSTLKTLDDVVARGKSGDLASGNSGNGTLSHLTTELFNLRMGTKILSVPYKGENALIPDIVGGTTPMGFINLPSALPLIKSARLRALAVTSAQPIPGMPQVRTLKSLGLDDFVIDGWAALFASKDVPADGVQRLEKALQAALGDPSVKERFASMGLDTTPSSAAALQDFYRTESMRWGDVVRLRGVKLD